MRLPYSVLAWMIRIFLAFITFGWRTVNTEIVKIIRGLNRKPHSSEFLYYTLFTMWGFSMDLQWTGRYWEVHFKGAVGKSYESVSFAVKLHNGAWAFNSKTVALINEKAKELLLGYDDHTELKEMADAALGTGYWVNHLNKMFGFLDMLKDTPKSIELDKGELHSIFSLWSIETQNLTKGVITGYTGEIKFGFSPMIIHGVLREHFFAELPHFVLKLDKVSPGSLAIKGVNAWKVLNSKTEELITRADTKLKAAKVA